MLNAPHFKLLPSGWWSSVTVLPLQGQRVAVVNQSLANQLTIPVDVIKQADGITGFGDFSPIATVYAGHQFGHYVPQLGDGRAHLIGDWVEGVSEQRWELQLKGSGPTPYSRRGDGRAVLRSTIREFLCSEAMAGLGIPTTRSLSLMTSTEAVYREQAERGAMMIRVSPSFLRFGHVEFAYYSGQDELLNAMLRYAIQADYPALWDAYCPKADKPLPQPLLEAWLQTVVEKTAKLIAQWQAVGFCHGVMNTDNMSLAGLTLDYGPFGFMESFVPGHICNHSDYEGRYAYHRQPDIGHWNCAALGQALARYLPAEAIHRCLERYPDVFKETYHQLMLEKLGLSVTQHGDDGQTVVAGLLTLLADNHIDYTWFFRQLSESAEESQPPQALTDLFESTPDQWYRWWQEDYQPRVQSLRIEEQHKRRETMLACNPAIVLRNSIAQQAIEDAEQDDFSTVEELLTLLQDPCGGKAAQSPWAACPPKGQPPIIVSCSS